MKASIPFFSKEEMAECLKKINNLSLKERKQLVKKELKNKELNNEKLQFLLLMDNTNEELIFRYLQSMDKSLAMLIIPKYVDYMSLSKIKELQLNIFGNLDGLYRQNSYKDLFFRVLSAVQKNNKNFLDKELLFTKAIRRNVELNNQPFDFENFDAFYYNLFDLFICQIEKQKGQNEKDYNDYLFSLRTYANSISKVLNKYNQREYEEEKKDIKKFLTVFFSIINIDTENRYQISQVAKVLREFSNEERNSKIFGIKMEIRDLFGENAADEFIKTIENKNIYCDFNYRFLNNKIEIPEECYSYEYLIKNNIFKKYERKIIDLMKVIYKSDLIKNLVKIVYKTEDKNMKFFFEENNFTEDFWKNNIIFIPFKIKKLSDFFFKHTFFFFFSIYKIRNFESEIEDEIFTLGAFLRVLIHETLGHLMMSYIFYMFHANIKDSGNYYSPRINKQIEELNQENMSEFIGNFLAKICFDNLPNLKNKNFIELDDSLKKKLCEKFIPVIGKEYAEKLVQKLLDNDVHIPINQNEKNISDLSKKIIDILVEFISDEFDKYINKNIYKQEQYKKSESGNFIEFLLFNNFSQNMTLKECLFLLNEEMYKDTNFIKFRSEYKSLIGKDNDIFLKELIDGQKIFADLFAKFFSLYEKDHNKSTDLVSQQNFRGNCDNDLNKKFDAFECFNYKRNISDYI